MNHASRQRIERAKRLAEVYARHSDVRVMIIGGSVARNAAHEGSDLDLGLFWVQIPPQEIRSDLLRRAGGLLSRSVDNHQRYHPGNPRCEGCIEIAKLEPNHDLPQMNLDLEHETVTGTQDVLTQVIDQGDLSLEKQELLSVIQSGVVLHGHNTADAWRAKAQIYADEWVSSMVSQYCVGIGEYLLDQVRWTQTQDWLCFYEGLLDVGRRLFLTLMGLNRRWVFTDNPNLKGMRSVAEGLTWQPVHFVDRLGWTLQNSAQVAIEGLADLSEEVLDLVEAQLPTMDMSVDREALKRVRYLL